MSKWRRASLAATVLCCAAGGPLAPARGAEPDSRYTAPTPDAIVERAARVAAQGGPDGLARALFITALSSEAAAGKARHALETVGKGKGPVAEQAHWLARELEPEASAAFTGALPVDAPTDEGMIRTFAVLGPFKDHNGEGLGRPEGPETPEHDWRKADYSWGANLVRPVRSVTSSVSARGLPLDLYIHPRRESCSYLAAVVTVPSAQKIVLHAAASGSFRLRWDRHDAAESAESHKRLRVDRAEVAVDADAGDHLVEVKACSNAQPDEGRVRVRLSAPDGKPLDLATSSEPARLQVAFERAAKADTKLVATPTPLDASIAFGEAAPSLDVALRAATVRILGGADDMQSPRAPGLLELVAGSPDTTADRLAMAGFLAPFGANRSGWLRRAVDRAKNDHDDDALAFAQRALVLARVGAGQQDLAQTTAAEAPLAGAHDPQAELIRAEVLARLGSQGLRVAALAALEEVAKASGGQTPEAVWRGIGQFAEGQRPSTELAALERLVELAPGYGGASFVEAHRMVGAEVMERIALGQLLTATDTRDFDRIGDMMLDLGRYQAARTAFSASAALSPNRAKAHDGLARALQALRAGAAGTPRSGTDGTEGVDEAIHAELGRIREIDPNDSSTGAELAFREGKRAAQVDFGRDAPFLVAPEVFLARAKASPAPAEGVFERQLHWRRVVRLHPDQRISQTIHYAREILVEPRTEEERYERVPFAGRTSELLIARVHRPDGTTLLPEEQDAGGSKVRWPKLKRGDVVEIALRYFTPGPVGRRGDAPFYFVDYVGGTVTRPVLYNEVVLDAPVGQPLAWDVVGGKADQKVENDVEGRHLTYLIWTAPPNIADEPLAPPSSETMPVVVGSIYPRWKDFMAWYRGAIQGFTEPDEDIKRKAAELTEGKKTREEKIAALFNYVADSIRYVNYTSGEWWLPNRPQFLLARKQGDCDDKANLLIALLRAVDIQATEVLVQTRYTGQPRIMLESKIAVPMFDHGIVYLPDPLPPPSDGHKKPGRFLDATSPQSRMGVPPSMDARAVALLVADGEVTPIPTPSSSSAEHGVVAEWKLTLDKDGAATLAADERHVGDSAFFLRVNLGQEDARAQWVEANVLSRWLPAAKLEPKVGFDGDLPGGGAKLDYRGRSAALARHEGDELVLTMAPPQPITMQIAPLAKRTLPVVLPPHLAPTHRDTTIEIALPDGYDAAALPPDDDLPAGDFGSAKSTFKLSADKRKIVLERSIRFEASRIEVADYAAWRAWLHDVDRMMHRAVRLVPKKK